VKVVNVQYNGAAFAFPAGEVLVENGNTNQDTFGVVRSTPYAAATSGLKLNFDAHVQWEKMPLEDDLYAFKHRATGFYIIAKGDVSTRFK
jgi:hypothetical protein